MFQADYNHYIFIIIDYYLFFLLQKLNELPTEILAEIFNLLPRENLSSIGNQCKKFHNIVGFIVKKDLLDWRRKLETVINNLKETLSESSYDKSLRWELCQKIGYVRWAMI